MSELRSDGTRADRLDRALRDLLSSTKDLEAASVVSFDGLPMASALPAGMDEDRVAAMSAALLSLGERATVGLGRGELSQVFIEGEHGTVFLVSADGEAVLVAVANKAAKTGLMLYEVKRCATQIADTLRAEQSVAAEAPTQPVEPAPGVEGIESPIWSSTDGIAPAHTYAPNGTGESAPLGYAPYGGESTGSTWS